MNFLRDEFVSFLERVTQHLASRVILAEHTFAFGTLCSQKAALLSGRVQRETLTCRRKGSEGRISGPGDREDLKPLTDHLRMNHNRSRYLKPGRTHTHTVLTSPDSPAASLSRLQPRAEMTSYLGDAEVCEVRVQTRSGGETVDDIPSPNCQHFFAAACSEP